MTPRGIPVILAACLAAGFAFPAGGAPTPAPAGCPVPAFPAGEEFPPPPAGDRGFDVLSYDLDIRLDPTGSRIQGTVAIGLASLVENLADVRLDLVDELTCTGISCDDRALAFSQQDEALLVELDIPLAAAASETLMIGWEGRPPRHGRMLVGLLYRHHNAGTPANPDDDVPIIANISEPWSAHAWWPCKDHPADKALVSVAVTVPDTLSVVGNGILLGVEQTEPGWHRFRWRETYPLPTYLVSVAVSDYEMWTESCDGTDGGPVSMEYHVFPPDRQRAQADFAPSCAMMRFLAGLAGPYPFTGEKYAQVEIKWTGAMEHTTATSISQMLLTGDGRFETLIVHEMAHQWFGDSLTPGTWADIWLNEGFARYCEALWVEHAYGQEEYRRFMATIGRERHPALFAGDGPLGDPDPILPNILVYDKGAWLLHSLRLLLGDDAFFAFLHSYATDPRLVQGTVCRQDLMAIAADFAGRDLAGFFTPWLQTDAVPEIRFETELAGNHARIVFHQMQDPVFEMAVPVRLRTAHGSVERTAVLTGRDQTCRWELDSPLEAAIIDPDSMVFMFLGEAPPPPLEVRGPAPNPLGNEGSSFQIFTTGPGRITAGLYDVRGRKLRGFDLGYHPATGPGEDESSIPINWDFAPGAIVPPPASGVYWLEFLGCGGRAVRRITLLR